MQSKYNKFTFKFLTKLSNFSKNRKNYYIFKCVVYNRGLPTKLRFYFANQYIYKGLSNIKYRCFINNNSRAVYSKLRLSRNTIKTYGFSGLINGWFKSSW